MQKWLKSIFTVVFIVFLFFCIGYTNQRPRYVTLLESALNRVLLFPKKAYNYAKAYITTDNDFFIEADSLKAENDSLKEKIKELEKKLVDYEEIYAKNQSLQSYMGLSENYLDYQLVLADIISDSATNWEATYVINRGSNDGVEKGMAVIAKEGLVGYVSDVSKNSSKIISILDAGNSVSSRVTRTREEIIVKGSTSSSGKQEMKIINIPSGISIIEGDRIETSGIGGIYPKGIGIGKVKEVINKKNPMENVAIVSPNVDFEKLESVAVIIGGKGEADV